MAAEVGARRVVKNTEGQVARNKAYRTNFQVIENTKPPKNNKSGHKGVGWDKSRSLWTAYIQVHGKKIHLGRYAKFDDAVKARIDAEETYFAPLIDKKNNKEN